MSGLINKISNCRYYKKLFYNNSEKIDNLYSLLYDQESKRVVNGIFRAYKSIFRKNTYYFKKICCSDCLNYHFTTKDNYKVKGTKNPYFINDIFKIDSNIVLMDGGGYVGDTVELLLNVLKKPCKHIYTFEPSKHNYRILKNRLNKFSSFIDCYNLGLSDTSGKVCFLNDGAGSRISEFGDSLIDVIDAGEFLSGLKENFPTFIKLDVEGHEKCILKAMSTYIINNKPNLAVSIYHSLEDL